MRNLLPLAPFVAVIPLGEALADGNWTRAAGLIVLVFAGLVAMTSRTVPHAASRRSSVSASASLACRAEAAAGHNGGEG